MFDICEKTIKELQAMFYEKKLSVKELVQEYITRIQNIDQGPNGLHSVLEINPDALYIAEELDQKGNDQNNLLFGIPILVKDNIDTADRMHTSAGSLALADSYARCDAELIQNLRKAGAVLLGKTNMTELANYMTENMPAGYSSRGGKTISPYNKEKDPSGSSTGSAVAVTANLCSASIGTDTSNSIIAPALTNGVIGFRPSTGSVSQKGIIPISHTLDTAGPFARTVEDCAVLYAALTGYPVIRDHNNNLKGKVIGFNVWNMENMPKNIVTRIQNVMKELEGEGAVIRKVDISKTKHIRDIMKYEFKYDMNQYLSTLPEAYPIKTLSDIIEFNKRHPEKTLKYGQTYLVDAQENTSGRLDEDIYRSVLQDRRERMATIREQIKKFDFCIMLSYNNILQYTALPGITIPCGIQEDGMPFGIYMTAKTDMELIAYAYEVERVIGHRVPPPLIIR